MNELYISRAWFYWKTNKTTADDAWDEFCVACEKAGIEIGGSCHHGFLRNADGDDIDPI